MAIRMTKNIKTTVLAAALALAGAYDVEIISDLVTPATDERRALDIKGQNFWQPLLDNAEASKMTSAYKHLSVYEEVEAAITALPAANSHVRELLNEALTKLKRTDHSVFNQAVESAEVSSQQLLDGPKDEDAFSFLTGGQNYFTQAIRRFVGFGKYSERLGQQIRRRQSDVAPMLRGAASVTTDVLRDCREASKLGFDVLKYDVYNKGVPKTPEAAKKAAYALIDAQSETRHNFMTGITEAARGIARDSNEKEIAPTATVTQTLAQGLNLPVAESKNVEIVFDF